MIVGEQEGPSVDLGKGPYGQTLFRQENAAGGYNYFSNEVVGGVHVWDTALVHQSTLLAAILFENERAYLEHLARTQPKAPESPNETPNPS
ncbi:MAG: hypothetical protein AAB262_07700 [Elusimicrobiota bacterium]